MVGFMKASGKMINKTAKAGFVIGRDNGELASGKMVISYNDFFYLFEFSHPNIREIFHEYIFIPKLFLCAYSVHQY